jgi:hypothetical protein
MRNQQNSTLPICCSAPAWKLLLAGVMGIQINLTAYSQVNELSGNFNDLDRHLHDRRLRSRGQKRTGHRGQGFRVPSNGHGDVFIADHTAGGGVKPLPAGAGQVYLRPGVGCAPA